jgi:hypothetical protein
VSEPNDQLAVTARHEEIAATFTKATGIDTPGWFVARAEELSGRPFPELTIDDIKFVRIVNRLYAEGGVL